MSKETHEWLSNNTLIGFTEKRGNAWHYREGDGNHYTGPVPVADVQRRLFDWTAVEHPLYVPSGAEGAMVEVPGRKAIARSDNDHVMGIFKDGYQPHQFGEWLVDNVSKILDDDLQIGSAGLLRGGAVAWVSVETPENVVTPEGVAFRPHILAASSLDGTIATTYKPVVTNVVCDNTMAAGLREAGTVFKAKATANSLLRLGEAREALGIVFQTSDAFAAEVADLCGRDYTDRQFEALTKGLAPIPADASKRGQTMATTKRDALMALWRNDERVAPWRGNAFGAWQAVNTYQQHVATVKGMERPERNMLRAVDGKSDAADADTLKRVLALC